MVLILFKLHVRIDSTLKMRLNGILKILFIPFIWLNIAINIIIGDNNIIVVNNLIMVY